MKTVFEGKEWIYSQLVTGGIKSVINGEVYKDRRPSGSLKEDIVINSLPMNNAFLQDGVFNVNCFVPYLEVKIQGTPQKQPNNARMKVISAEVYRLLDNIWKEQYNMTVVYHQMFDEGSEDVNYINFRVQMYLYNT